MEWVILGTGFLIGFGIGYYKGNKAGSKKPAT